MHSSENKSIILLDQDYDWNAPKTSRGILYFLFCYKPYLQIWSNVKHIQHLMRSVKHNRYNKEKKGIIRRKTKHMLEYYALF